MYKPSDRIQRIDEDGHAERGTVLVYSADIDTYKVSVDIDAIAWKGSVMGPPSSVTAYWPAIEVTPMDDLTDRERKVLDILSELSLAVRKAFTEHPYALSEVDDLVDQALDIFN